MSSSDELKALLRTAISPSNNGNDNNDDDLASLLSGSDIDVSSSYSAIAKGLEAVKAQSALLSTIGILSLSFIINITH